MKAIRVLTLALVLFVVVAGLALAQDSVERQRELLSSGASESASDGVSLRATLGQPVVGVVAGADVTLRQGFSHGAVAYRIYLPLALRDGS
jgi:hypothetical protein